MQQSYAAICLISTRKVPRHGLDFRVTASLKSQCATQLYPKYGWTGWQFHVNYDTFAQVPLLYSDNTNGTLYVSKLPIFKFVLLFCDGELVVHVRGHEIWLSSSVLLACAHLGIKTAQPKIGE